MGDLSACIFGASGGIGAALTARLADRADVPVVYAGARSAMKASGTVATLLPGAYYFMRETQAPPVAALRAAGVPIALATDNNPGTSPLTSILLVMNMAATLFRMTVDECLLGVTANPARALGLQDEVGTLEPGKACDLAIWDIERPAELVYRIGFNPLWLRLALAAGLLWNPTAIVAIYAGLGVVVLASRLLFPAAKRQFKAEAPAEAAQLPQNDDNAFELAKAA